MIYAVNKRTKEHRLDDGVKTDEEAWVEADAYGWIEWDGDGNPLPHGAPCDVLVFGRTARNVTAQDNPAWEGVTHYRPILDADTKPAWDGEGLPPVGTVCEAYIHHGAWRWAEAEILKHGEGECAVYATKLRCLAWGTDFRPIRSEEDRAVDALKAATKKPGRCNMLCDSWAKAIYAAIRDGKVPGVKLEGGS